MVNKEFLQEIPATCQQHWAFLCDTSAMSSVAPITFVPEIQLVNGNWRQHQDAWLHCNNDIDIIIGNINMYVRFYICDASVPILGVNDLVNNSVELNLRNFNDSYLQQHGHQELLQHIGHHFYIPAILTEANKLNVVWQTSVQQAFLDANAHYSQLSGILTSDIAIEDSYMEAHPATSLRSPSTPSPQDLAQQNLSHMPYRNWCPICVQAKCRSGQHCRHQHQHSTIQLDCWFMHNPHSRVTSLQEKPKNITIFIMQRSHHAQERANKTSDTTSQTFLSWSMTSPIPSSRPTARMPSWSSPNKQHNNWVFQQSRVQHMIIVAKEPSRGFIIPCSFN